ncbi:RAD55 family ATPase [Geoglobus sp.]
MGSILLIGSPGTGKTRLILKYLKHYDKALWVSTTESAPDVRRKLNDFEGELWVVDTHTWDQKVEVEKRDIIVSNPMNLNEVSIAIGKALDSLKRGYFIAFDSISGLLLYHTPQKVIHFLRNIVVRMNTDNGAGIFTLVKNAHDIHTETSISLIFQNIVELERVFNSDSVKRYIRVIRASQYVEREVAEFKFVENDVVIPEELDRFIKNQLNIKS